MIRSNRILAVLSITAVALLIYARGLDISPASLHPDEALLREQAQAIAATGRDTEGRLLPLYFHFRGNVWVQPLPVYFTALFLATSGLTESAIRLPSVIAAIVDLALLYGLARGLFESNGLALLAAGLLALTPLHFIHGRLALPSVYPIAFILVWLLCVTAFIRRRRSWLLFASTLSLGVGFYAHPSSVLTMPLYLGLTWLVAGRLSTGAPGSVVGGSTSLGILAAAGFVLPLVVLIPWFAWHYDVFRFTLGDWGLHTLANPRDGLRYSLFNWSALATRSSVYWGFFSPSYLFLTGGADLVGSTRGAGALLSVTAIPFLVGVYQIVKTRWTDPVWRLILLGLALAPVAASAFNEPKAAGRALNMLPFAVLITVEGVRCLFGQRQPVMRLAAIAVLALLPIQFYRFYTDYFTGYPQRSSAAFGVVRE